MTTKTTTFSRLFDEAVYDVLMEGICVNTAPYTTVLPTGNRERSIRYATPLPQLRGRPIIRAMQPKRLHRHECAKRACGPDFRFENMHAPLQTYQGGFMARAVSNRFPDRDHLQRVNPVVYLHGTSTIPGQLHFGHFIPRDDVTTVTMPVIRTDSTEQSIYLLAGEDVVRKREFTLRRAPYQNARVARENRKLAQDVLETLAEALSTDDDRKAELTEVQTLINKNPSTSEVDAWLKKKNEMLKKDAERRNIPNVEIRQALPGYTVMPPMTFTDHRVHGQSLTAMHVGLTFLAFYSRTPTLGGHVSRGCGAYMDCVYRVSVTNEQFAPPTFDCLFRVTPFKPLRVCLEDSTIDESTWKDIDELPWMPAETVGFAEHEAPDCFVTRAIAAWNAYDKSKFDFSFVPRGTVVNEGENDDDDTV